MDNRQKGQIGYNIVKGVTNACACGSFPSNTAIRSFRALYAAQRRGIINTIIPEGRTNMAAEQWDAYLADGRKAGRTLLRGEPIPAGLFHIVSDVLVKHTDGDYLVMQRDYRKKGYPGKFEAGASGAVRKGESPYEGALRELTEETGIRPESLTFLFAASDLEDTLYFSYLCLTDCPKDSVTLQEGETISCRWLPEDEFFAFIQTPDFAQGPLTRWSPYLDTVKAFHG